MCVLSPVDHWWKKHSKTPINGKLACGNFSWLEELMLLKYLNYPQRSADQCNLITVPMLFFMKLGGKNEICIEQWKAPNSHSNLDQKEKNWRNHNTWIKALLYSVDLNIMMLTLKQIPINAATQRVQEQIHTSLCQEHTLGKDSVLKKSCWTS